MAQSQRVLSGSRTRGSTATPSGSIIYSYQGIYAKSDASFFGSLLPRIGSGNRLKLYKGSTPVSDAVFDDSISMNNDTADMPGGEDAPLTVRVSFDLERMTLGQAPTTQQGDKFVDINGFNPVAYLEDPGNIMWPVNLWNVGTLPEHAFDGVIEPLDIKAEILGLSGKYSGHKVRGAIMGSFADSERGGRKIRDVRRLTANPPQPFFDGPQQMARLRNTTADEVTGPVPVSARLAQTSLSASAWADPLSALPLQSYQGLYDEVEAPFVEKDYQNVVYSQLNEHNPRDFRDLNAGIVDAYLLESDWRSNSPDPKFTYSHGSSLVAWWRMQTDVSSQSSAGPPTLPSMPDTSDNDFTGSFASNAERPAHLNVGPSNYIATSCANFNGTSDWMQVTGGGDGPDWTDLIGGSYVGNDLKAWSFACWIYVDSFIGSSMTIMNCGNSDYASNLGLFLSRTTIEGVYHGTVGVERGGAGSGARNGASSSTGRIEAGEWVHIVVTYAGTFDPTAQTPPEQFNIYINGGSDKSVEVGHNIASDAPTDPANRLSIGAGKGSSSAYRNHFDGRISDCAVWSTVLDLDSVRALYTIAISGPAGVSPDWVVQENIMTTALGLMSSSMNSSIDPLDEPSNHGFYFGKKAGSIVYGDW